MHKIIIFTFLFVFINALKAFAYPDFIGFGYRSCLACHESGSGGGATTDYARGVMASEIAANPFSRWVTDEEQAQVSNFMFKAELPWWIRLGLKYRALTVEKSPGSSQSRKLYYNMQNELNFNLFATENHKFGLITTLGYIENPIALLPNKVIQPNSYLYWREYFLKLNLSKQFWLYTGFMDKVFGIKTVNHTAINRANLSLGQNDQVHSAMIQWARPNEDLFIQYWIGNLHLSEKDRRKGGSFMVDKKWGLSHAYGFSLLSEKKESTQQGIFSLHNKMGFGNGNSLLTEVGYKSEKTILAGQEAASNSYYLFTQNNLNLVRGYFLLSSLELSKNLSVADASTNLKWDIGFLIFPIQKMEFRLSAINQKTLNAPEAVKDQWSIQSQIHFSL